MTELDVRDDNSGEYKVEAIWNNAIYTKELASNPLGFYYLDF